MDQQNTPHRASLILQTRSQDLDPGKAQRGNLSRKQNRKPGRGPEKQKNRNYDGNWIKILLPQKKQTKARGRTRSNRDREKAYQSLGPAIVTGRWSEAQSHENTGISKNSSSNPRPTDFSSKSQPEGEKKRANQGRGNVLVASLWESFLSLFVCLFVCSRGKKVLLLCGTLSDGVPQSLKGAKSANPNHQHHDNNTSFVPFSPLLASRIHARCERSDFVPPGWVARALPPGELKERKKETSLSRSLSLAPRKVLFDVLPRKHRPWR